MKILVLSDSHSGLSFMRYAIGKVRPDAVIHLGDYYDDGETLSQEYPNLPFHIVPGNCDRYRSVGIHPETLCYGVCGVRFFMTHGHNHFVKSGLYSLMKDARAAGASAALYGHTHEAYCTREEDGLWVLNPGACGSTGGSVGVIETNGKEILSCRILRRTELEELL
jgi:putative phosphoesterase